MGQDQSLAALLEQAIEKVLSGSSDVQISLTGNDQEDAIISSVNKLFQVFDQQKKSLAEGSIFKELFERSGDAISIIENGVFIDSNFSAMRQFQYTTKSEILKVHPSALSPEEQPDGRSSREKADDIMNTALAQGSIRFEWWHKLRNGTLFPAEIVLTTLVNEPGRKVFHSVMRDITEQKRNQRELENANVEISRLHKEIELILQSTGEGIYRLDDRGKITFMNKAGLTLVGRALSEVVGHSPHDLIHSSTQSEHDEQKSCPLCNTVTSGEAHLTDDGVFWRKDGTSFPVEYISVPIKSDGGVLRGAVVSFLDITERKKAEAELKHSNERLKQAVEEIQRLKMQLEQENDYLQEEIKLDHNFEEIISKSKVFRKVLKDIEHVALTDATVLIEGESGTGKELIARAVHNLSDRKGRALVKVNCAVLPANLIESELFGHVKGAFTGAYSDKTGRFELADKGTIFLDEIGEMPMELQAKLLRVLQEGEFDRLGSNRTLKVDVRVIAATNVKLKEAVKDGKFREDLYYRLNVFPMRIPPLRERKEDIGILAQHFLMKYNLKFNRHIESISRHVLTLLTNYNWPGNVRELENVIERAVITSRGKSLEITESLQMAETDNQNEGIVTLTEIEKSYITKVLNKTNWRVGGDNGAASLLGLKRTTLVEKMKKLGIER
ncbi:sigma 54-interacting transcriptional regulator [uncultured Imperialibacter sp.]|uniref:sigma 54-interacting transcriptional regulator n=1 Tax=uncultured Imperialibacter sp. TaxID=1672639 RepID=UPI0030DAF0C1|tara:strand:- start:79486 stop:81492 length:2007 start_codon:yes stop_codon:yes gene_type:complete